MKPSLLIEEVDYQSIDNQIIVEAEEGSAPVKKYYINGPYLEAETKNHNGRIYPQAVLEREVKKLVEGKIKQNRLMGELEHPTTTTINLDRVSHLIKELKMEKNIGVGKSLVLETPMGKIAQSLIDAGVKLGVSTRGVGSLRESIVQNDFSLITVDIVADPSAPSAFVDGILESKKEWVMENGILVEKDLETLEENLDKYTVEEKATAAVKVFEDFMSMIRGEYIAKK